MVSKCYGLLETLALATPYPSKQLLKLTYTALIRSHLEYCSSLYSSVAIIIIIIIIIISLFKKLTNRSLIQYTTISEKRKQYESVNKLINIWLVCMAAGYNVYHSMQ